MNMKKVELLAPAGNYEGFLGAVHAGADAVYLGGQRFGARAFADNFTEEEAIAAIRYAHIYGRKVYLTLNTLVKEREFGEICGYLKPLYENGLDGVIIQDFGVFRAVGEWFPDLERHISTQMTVTGEYGADFLKKLDAVRIVPARELSLKEISRIKEKTNIEIETFVHGAVCYCYSGQCLFSSILGGRSGNRGRCAQPCRLPYTINNRQQYPLSLKDMCTIEVLPELIEAGIDSFKIEGRMKSPEYTAGVTAVYRKYIDRYYSNPKADYQVEESDMENLRSLYIRSEISTGYYYKHNGKEMITLDSPGYAGRDEALNAAIRVNYLEADFRLPITGKACFQKGKPAEYKVSYGDCSVTVQGENVQEAQKQPLTKENILKQLQKNGNTPFVLKDIALHMENDIFMPVKALNDLRRNACLLLEEKIIEQNGLSYAERTAATEDSRKASDIIKPNDKIESNNKAVQKSDDESNDKAVQKSHDESNDKASSESNTKLHVLVSTMEQLREALASHAERIYLADCICRDWRPENIPPWLLEQIKAVQTSLYLALPYIIRIRDGGYLQQMKELLETDVFDGVLVRNLEEIEWLRRIGYHKNTVSDQNLYIWNKEACLFMNAAGREHYISCELNYHEIRELTAAMTEAAPAISIYGRIPMMISANCAAATEGNCRKQAGYTSITDRYNKTFPVYLNCNHCYNIIYNSLPLSLHQNVRQIEACGIHTFRLDFTTETGNDAAKIIKFFKKQIISDAGTPPYLEYTKGHFKRGAE